MSKPASRTEAVTPSEREDLLDALLLGEQELTFTPRGDPDPRLVRLVEFLARQAARECYEAESKQKEDRTS